MASISKGLARWADRISALPTVLASSNPSYWSGAEFQKVVAAYYGYVDTVNDEILVYWAHGPIKARFLGQKTFSPMPQKPSVLMPNEICCGEWEGAQPGFNLAIPKEFAEQALHIRLPERLDTPIDELSSQIEHLLNVINLDVGKRSPAGPALGETAIVQILHLLFPDQGTTSTIGKPSKSDHHVNRAREMIEANLASPISLIGLAESLDLSARHLTRVFHAATGLAPHAYVLQRRVERARALIERGGLTLAEVAEQTGFASHAHMTTTFQKILGVTPSHFSNRKL